MKNNKVTSNYIIGFTISVTLTLAAYFLVINQVFSGFTLIVVIITLALVQLLVQLAFFLHLFQESKPRWNLIITISTCLLILMIIVGSLWIMNNLNYNHLHSESETNSYIQQDEGIHK